MSQQEQWRQIKGFEGLYDVSDKGRIWSRKRNKILSGSKNKDGYLRVKLFKNRKEFRKLIHRIVAETFIPNPEGFPEVHHRNEDKADNRVGNLQWVNHQFNTEFSNSKKIVLYGPDNERVEVFNINKFARENNLVRSNLSGVAKGTINSLGGYTRKPGMKLYRKGSFRLISPEGHTVTFQSQKDAADYIDDIKQNISKLLKGKRKSVKGWTRAN